MLSNISIFITSLKRTENFTRLVIKTTGEIEKKVGVIEANSQR